MVRQMLLEKSVINMLQEDERVRVLHIENGGISNARNTGVKEASTDWIIFVDSDDYYDRRTVEYLVGLRD